MRKILIALLFISLAYTTASAHHSKRYLQVEGYDLPGRGGVLLFFNMGYHVPDMDESAENNWQFAPGVFYGLSSRLGIDLHSHLHKHAGGDLEYEATSLALISTVLPDELNPKAVRPALAVEYERSATDEPDLFSFKLIVGGDFGPFNLTANYIGQAPIDSDEKYRSLYAAGVSKPWGPIFQMGLEVKGALSGVNQHYLIPGLYLSISKFLALKAGAAFGITKASEDFSVRSAIHLTL